jgi:phosphoribosylanthranilate isomerase
MERQGKNARPALKICGLTTAEDVAACLRRGVDFLGFNLYPHSKRFVSAEAAQDLWRTAAAVTPKSKCLPVAVMVDPTPEAVAAALAAFPDLAVLQLHGDETPSTVAAARRALGARWHREMRVISFVRGANGVLLALGHDNPGILDGTATVYVAPGPCITLLGW